jgi:serine/threonine protein kinase
MLGAGDGRGHSTFVSRVADLSPREREQYFDRREVPPHLRAEVESLLRFDTPPTESLAGCVAATATQFLDSDTGPGEGGRCGPYELVHLLGRGGMGAVFLAKRTDGEVEQRVAIKFVRNAAGEPAFRDRFLRERQILASLSHPGIARLLDAGHTSAGQPYLVMEYVDGIPIDVYAEALDLRGKLRLFLLVCDAIS